MDPGLVDSSIHLTKWGVKLEPRSWSTTKNMENTDLTAQRATLEMVGTKVKDSESPKIVR